MPPTNTSVPPREADVLIVGCGPAGLLLAAQLAQMPDISTLIVDEKLGPLQLGQADGVSGRSLEIFQALNFSEKVLKEAYYLHAITFWSSTEDEPEKIIRRYKKPDGRTAYSQFPHVVLNQARIHDFLLERMACSAAQLQPHYGLKLTDLSVTYESSDTCQHPVTASFETAEPRKTESHSISAKYLVGCDGARSSVRQAMGLTLQGDAANKSWGVMDLLVTTDFPDIRMKSVIQSHGHGNVMIIPREGNHLVRIYVELDELGQHERVSDRKIDVQTLINTTQRVLAPYQFEVKQVVWWSVYEIGQRIATHFDDRHQITGSHCHPRCYIAGDACHTHSPKAGQGMNVSMHDAFNLGWKLAAVLRNQSPPSLLKTYSDERHSVAQELIDFDRELTRHFSRSDPSAVSATSTLQEALLKADGYVSGTLTKYQPSMIVDSFGDSSHTGKLSLGSRLPSAPVLRLSDARPMQLSEALPADGRWRIVLFADQHPPSSKASKAIQLVRQLSERSDSPIGQFTPPNANIDSVIEILAVFQQNYDVIEFHHLPDLLWPLKGDLSLRDYSKVFCCDQAENNALATFHADSKLGCVAVVRPDQHLAALYDLADYRQLADFFSRFMMPGNGQSNRG